MTLGQYSHVVQLSGGISSGSNHQRNSTWPRTVFTPSLAVVVKYISIHRAWVEHQFLSGIRDSRKAQSLWGMMRGVGEVRKSIHQSWLAKGLGLGLLCWGFKGVQEEIPSEEVSTLRIGSVAFPLEQCTSLQLHPCHWLFDQDGHQDSSSPSLQSPPWSLWLLLIP